MTARLFGILWVGVISGFVFTGCVVHDRDYHREGYYRDDVRHGPPPPPPPIEHRDDVRIDVHP